jgi:methyltransferase family protein
MRDIYEPFQRRFRPKRLRLFYSCFSLTEETRVLDLGGGLYFWELAKNEGLPVPQVTVLNVRPGPTQLLPQVRWLIGDARSTGFEDNSFDIVFSNSLIEHLEDWEGQLQFANEARRLAPNYFVQTPDKRFPIEPHFVTPFVHWLPKRVRASVLRNGTLWGLIQRPDQDMCQKLVREIELLGPKQMRCLFPDSKMISEHFAGIPKSLVAFRATTRKGANKS